MLRLFIIIGVFIIVFHFIYKWMKKAINYWNNELSNDSLFDQKEKIKQDKERFNEDLKNTEKELKVKQKEVEKLKKRLKGKV